MKEKQKWPLHLVFVRHAESERNVAKQLADRSGDLEYGGRLRNIDVDITARGRKQAEATGRYLGQQFRFDRVFASGRSLGTPLSLWRCHTFPHT
jgi:broad specificity phosphatase PhoE